MMWTAWRRIEAIIIHRRGLAVVLVGVFTFMGAASMRLIAPAPQPWVSDEFCYLLAAQTYAAGRLTNPAHPRAPSLEAQHVLQQPTYQAKYPPMQGLVMALGIVLVDNPMVGVWLSVAAMAAAICWMLQGWFPTRLAFFVALLVGMRFGITGYWAQSYWGGAVAACAGAVVLGCLPRLLNRPRPRIGLLLALALVVLANSRPYEGLIASLPVAAVLAWHAPHFFRADRHRWLTIVLPAVIVLTAGALVMGVYHRAVTGSAWKMPYQEYEEWHNVAPLFVFGSLRDLPPAPDAMQEAERQFMLRLYHEKLGWTKAVSRSAAHLGEAWVWYIGWGWTLLLAGVFLSQRRRLVLLAAVILAAVCVGASLSISVNHHYLSPALGALMVLVAAGLEGIGSLTLRRHRLLPWVIGAVMLAAMWNLALDVRQHRWDHTTNHWNSYRMKVAEELAQKTGKHLVLAYYGPNHLNAKDWVHNGPDIDGQQVVWARSVNPALDAALYEYFADRTVWTAYVENDESPARLEMLRPPVNAATRPDHPGPQAR